MEMERDLPVFCVPYSDKVERISLERVFMECFSRLYSLATLTGHCEPTMTVISRESRFV